MGPAKKDEINPRSPVPVFRQVADIIRADIVSGKLPANEPIPSQAQLTETYHVARGTAAKAIRSLRDQGFVFIVTGKGAFASPPGEWRPGQ